MTTYDGDLLEDVALEGRGRATDGKNVSVLVTSGARRTSGVMPPRLTKDERRRRERERRLPPCSEQVGRRARNCRHPPGQPAVQTVAGEGDSIQRPNPERIEAHTGAGRVGGRVQDREGSGRARRRQTTPSRPIRRSSRLPRSCRGPRQIAARPTSRAVRRKNSGGRRAEGERLGRSNQCASSAADLARPTLFRPPCSRSLAPSRSTSLLPPSPLALVR